MAAAPVSAATDPGVDVEVVGRRVEALLEVIADAEPAARTAAEDLIRELLGLYGAALGRLVALLERVAPDAVRTLADDPLLAGLLVLHDLHPVPVRERIESAIAEVPGVRVAAVSETAVRLVVTVGCTCCDPQLPAGVEAAVRAAAPEIPDVEVVAAGAAERNGLIPAAALTVRRSGNGR